ncbi:YciI family protein [Micromonospora sp. CPCC 206061]|uniref:YciI family protein n=1 Tax=Micromonospora sp. CPCC 206061 TaxID=3122410 RepID=UPI003FA543AE
MGLLSRSSATSVRASSAANAGIVASEVMYPVIQRPSRPRPYGAGMWIVELRFSDAPERLAARPAHRERLAELHHAGAVRMAGPLADGSGAVLVFDVPDEDALDRLLDADPYFATLGVEVASKRAWEPLTLCAPAGSPRPVPESPHRCAAC